MMRIMQHFGESHRETEVKMTFVALVVGATGAVGRDLVAELVDSAHCSKVVALTRREIPESSWGATFPSMNVTEAANKLEIVAVDFDELHSEWTKVPVEDADAAFSCLGTTRKDAGSAEAFRKVDLEYVTNFATLAKKSGIPYFGLLTSTGANKDSWFLYPQTKGEVEENVKNLGFERTSIFRPGLIDRGELTRTIEFIGSYVMSTIATRTIAKAMLGDYESGLPGLHEYSDSMLRAYAAAK